MATLMVNQLDLSSPHSLTGYKHTTVTKADLFLVINDAIRGDLEGLTDIRMGRVRSAADFESFKQQLYHDILWKK